MVCDESSAIKAFDGKQRAAVTEFLRTIPYRLLCTATAAPNDYIELGTSSEALGVMGQVDMLNRFFKNDNNTSDQRAHWRGFSAPRELHQQHWRFKGHAELPFWRWVCGWARAGRKPSDFGPYSDKRFKLPKLIEREHIVETRTLADGMLFALPATNMQEEREEKRRTIPERCEMAGALTANTGLGVGSEVYEAVRNGRRGIGIELKPSYYRQAVKNVAKAVTDAAEEVEQLAFGVLEETEMQESTLE